MWDILSQVWAKYQNFQNIMYKIILQVVRWWHHQLTHLHIHIDWSRNVLWKFAKLQYVITSLFFNRFSSGFHYYVWKFLLVFLKFKLTLIRPGGGGIHPPPSTFRAIISRNFFPAHRAFATFFFQVLRNFWCYFRKNRAYRSEVTQRYVIERRLKIWEFSGFVYKTYEKWLFVLKINFGPKSVLFALILVNITVICIDYQYLNKFQIKKQ